jgi:hypothetical protein
MKKVLLIAAILLMGVSSFALFRASDIVYVLAAADTPGGGGTYWQTDVWVTNPGIVSVLLTVEYLPTGEAGNPNPNDPASRYFIDWPDPIGPKATLYIPNVVAEIKEAYPTVAVSGALIFYGEFASGGIANLVVNSRTYTPKNTFDPAEGYYGQDIGGTPWFYYVDSAYATQQMDAHWLTGLTENGAFRTNVGIVNGSQNHILDVKFELYDPAGAKVSEVTVTNIGALAHVQYNQILKNKFSLTTAVDYALRISITKATEINPDLTLSPALFTYGSKVDNMTGDPNYIEATYFMEVPATDTVVNCIWP